MSKWAAVAVALFLSSLEDDDLRRGLTMFVSRLRGSVDEDDDDDAAAALACGWAAIECIFGYLYRGSLPRCYAKALMDGRASGQAGERTGERTGERAGGVSVDADECER